MEQVPDSKSNSCVSWTEMQNDGYKKPAYSDDVAQFFFLSLRPLEPGSTYSQVTSQQPLIGRKFIVRIPGWNVKKIQTVQYTNKHPVINCGPKLPLVSCLILHYISSCFASYLMDYERLS